MSQKGIGYSYKEAEELRKQHEQLELRCTVSKLADLSSLYFSNLAVANLHGDSRKSNSNIKGPFSSKGTIEH